MEEEYAGENRIRPFAIFALAVLFSCSLLSSLDRYIMSILAQSIKHDLAINDAKLGFLLGTAFAIFYAIIGIGMGRIADGVNRPRLMTAGLMLWSGMTAMGGMAMNFTTLGLARVGVGVGEASANPSSYSLISDYIPARNRSMAMSVFIAGSFVGNMLSMVIGGAFVTHWPEVCHLVPIANACALPGWKATLIAVGLPGIPLALIVLTLPEPRKAERAKIPLGPLVARELGASLPPFTLFSLYRAGGSGALLRNLGLIALLAAIAGGMIWALGDAVQWIANAIGAYSIYSWGRVQKLRDRPFFELTFGSPTFLTVTLGCAIVACMTGSVTAWSAPYAIRTLHMTPATAGWTLGLSQTTASVIAVLIGGWVCDRWKRHDSRAPVWLVIISALGAMPGLAIMLTAGSVSTFLIGYAAFGFVGMLWSGCVGALIQELVLPRMRASAASAFALFNVVLAAGLGPYSVGKISTLTGSLAMGMAGMQLLAPLAMIVLLFAASRLRAESFGSRHARAEAAGEPGFAGLAVPAGA